MNGSIFGLSPAATFWVVVSALALLALVLFSGILLPFAAGFVLAYLFHPIVSGMGRARIPRGAAAFVIVALSMIVLAAFIALIVPPIFHPAGRAYRESAHMVRARSKLSHRALWPLFAAPHGAAKARRAGACGADQAARPPRG